MRTDRQFRRPNKQNFGADKVDLLEITGFQFEVMQICTRFLLTALCKFLTLEGKVLRLSTVLIGQTLSVIPLLISNPDVVRLVDMLHLEVANKVYDVVVLVETHLDSSIADGEIFPANYLVFRRDRMCNGRRGGGDLIAGATPSNLH